MRLRNSAQVMARQSQRHGPDDTNSSELLEGLAFELLGGHRAENTELSSINDKLDQVVEGQTRAAQRIEEIDRRSSRRSWVLMFPAAIVGWFVARSFDGFTWSHRSLGPSKQLIALPQDGAAGSLVKAVQDGVVAAILPEPSSFGPPKWSMHLALDSGYRFEYGNLDELFVKIGQRVKAGEQIALVRFA